MIKKFNFQSIAFINHACILVLLLSCFYNSFGQKKKSIPGNLSLDTIGVAHEKNIDLKFDALNWEVNTKPVYVIDQDGYMSVTINNINLFRYSVKLAEFQDNSINTVTLSDRKILIGVEPFAFNLNVPMNIKVRTVGFNPDTQTKQLWITRSSMDSTEAVVKKLYREESNLFHKYSRSLKIAKEANALDSFIKASEAKLNLLDTEKKQNKKPSSALKLQIELSRLRLEKIGIQKIENARSFIENYVTKRDSVKEKIDNAELYYSELRRNYNNTYQASDNAEVKIQEFNEVIIDYIRSIRELNKISEYYESLLCILYSDLKYEDIETEKLLLTKLSFVQAIQSRSHLLDALWARFDKVNSVFDKVSEIYTDVSATNVQNDTFGFIYNELTQIHDKISFERYKQIFSQVLKVYDAINPSNFTLTYYTMVIQDNADLISYSFSAIPHDNMPCTVEPQSILFNYQIRIKGGVKIDYSTAAGVNLGVNDVKYRFEAVGDSTKVLKVNEIDDLENLFIPSVGILFHTYWRSNRNVRLGINFGASTNTNVANYHCGLSVLFGKSQRVNLNAGISGRSISVADDYYVDLADSGDFLPINRVNLPDNVPLSSSRPHRIGFYAGISYNFNVGSDVDAVLKTFSVN